MDDYLWLVFDRHGEVVGITEYRPTEVPSNGIAIKVHALGRGPAIMGKTVNDQTTITVTFTVPN
jgi:hypothetical protein